MKVFATFFNWHGQIRPHFLRPINNRTVSELEKRSRFFFVKKLVIGGMSTNVENYKLILDLRENKDIKFYVYTFQYIRASLIYSHDWVVSM